MKVVFFSWLAKSAVNDSIPIILELIKNNVQVYYYGFEENKKLLDGLKIDYITYTNYNINKSKVDKLIDENKLRIESTKDLREIFISNITLSYERYAKLYKIYMEELIDEVRAIDPSYIFKDNAAFHGKLIGTMLGIKTVGYNPLITVDKSYFENNTLSKYLDFYGMSDEKERFDSEKMKGFFQELEKRNKDICEKNQIPELSIIEASNGENYLTICYGGEPINPRLEDKSVRFVKPVITEMKIESLFDKDIESFLKDDKPLIYVASGSEVAEDNNYYLKFVEAFYHKPYNLLIAIPNLAENNSKLPSNIKIVGLINQIEVLKKADIFITMGGYGSIREAIMLEVPMIVYPKLNDQFFNAIRVEEVGIGIHGGKHEFNAVKIGELVEEVLHNDKYERNIKEVKEFFEKRESLESVISEIVG